MRRINVFAPMGRMAAVVLGLGLAVSGPAEAQSPGGPKQWAVIVAIQHYENLKGKDLECTLRDASELKATLMTRGGMPEANILLMTDESEAGLQPRSVNLRERIEPFLARAAAGDRVVVYFSGHGLLVDGKSLLLPADYRAGSPQTGLPVDFMREALRRCAAASKFLILDCCHAGSEKGVDDGGDEPEAGFRPEDFRPSSKGKDDFVTIASCRAEQKSLQWAGKGMSFFTYWLCRGLEGGADRNGDGNLTFTEVFDYTFARVKDSVEKAYHQDQEPVRGINQQVSGDPVLLTLRPERPDTLCRRLAAEVDVEVRARKLRRVAVRRFTPPVLRDEELAGANYTVLMAEKVRAALAELARVAPRYEVSAALLPGFGGDVTRDGDLLRARAGSAPGGPIDALVDGTLKRTAGKLQVACDLILVDGAGSVAQFTSRMPSLRPEDYGDAGVSVARFRPVAVEASANRPPVLPATHIKDPAQEPHPLDPASRSPFTADFRVEVWPVGGTRAKRAVFNGNSMVIGARRGEEYEVRVWNTSNRKVGVALLVDGVNSYGMKREELAKARVWALAPRTDTYYAFEGFVPEPSAPGTTQPASPAATYRGRRFEFADVAESITAQRGLYGDAVGTISLAFFHKRDEGGKGEIATKEGRDYERAMSAEDFPVGDCFGTIVIRYVEESDLAMRTSR